MAKEMMNNYVLLEESKWSWARPGSDSSKVLCILCNTQISVKKVVRWNLISHSLGKRHKAFENLASKNNIHSSGMAKEMVNNYALLEEPEWSWARPGSDSSKVLCKLCNTQLCTKKMGNWALISHSMGKTHKAFENLASKNNIIHSPGTNSEPADIRSHSCEDTHEIQIPVNNANAELVWSASSLDMDSEEIQNTPLSNVQKTDEDVILLKREPDCVECFDETDTKEISSYGSEIDEPIRRLAQEIEILQHCAVEKAELCEATGNIRYVAESNIFRRIAEEKNQELEKVKGLLGANVIQVEKTMAWRLRKPWLGD